MSATTLVPGYKQVESFGPDEDYLEEEEDVSYVTLDLGVVEPTLLPSSSTYRMIGLDTPTPFLQLSGSIFKGRHDALLGTELLFTDEKNGAQPNRRSLVHVGTTEQRIRFKEVRLKEKAREEPIPPGGRIASDIQEEVESMYVDTNPTAQAPPSVPVEQPNASGSTTRSKSPRKKKKKGTRKGKEPPMEEDSMSTA